MKVQLCYQVRGECAGQERAVGEVGREHESNRSSSQGAFQKAQGPAFGFLGSEQNNQIAGYSRHQSGSKCSHQKVKSVFHGAPFLSWVVIRLQRITTRNLQKITCNLQLKCNLVQRVAVAHTAVLQPTATHLFRVSC